MPIDHATLPPGFGGVLGRYSSSTGAALINIRTTPLMGILSASYQRELKACALRIWCGYDRYVPKDEMSEFLQSRDVLFGEIFYNRIELGITRR
jgi:hypothetical protein